MPKTLLSIAAALLVRLLLSKMRTNDVIHRRP
jgi:hypothetical protein